MDHYFGQPTRIGVVGLVAAAALSSTVFLVNSHGTAIIHDLEASNFSISGSGQAIDEETGEIAWEAVVVQEAHEQTRWFVWRSSRGWGTVEDAAALTSPIFAIHPPGNGSSRAPG